MFLFLYRASLSRLLFHTHAFVDLNSTFNYLSLFSEQTFGCPIQHLCEREKTNVPSFVKACIEAIERRGISRNKYEWEYEWTFVDFIAHHESVARAMDNYGVEAIYQSVVLSVLSNMFLYLCRSKIWWSVSSLW